MDNPILTGERQNLIAARLAAEGRVVAQDLARELGVSEDTIRRDLRSLARQGRLRRVYGGALPLAPAAAEPVAVRAGQRAAAKSALARAALDAIPEGTLVFLDAGSTSLALAEVLPPDRGLTVATHVPAIAALIEDRPGIALIVVGGILHRPTGACLGAGAVEALGTLRPDICVIGACGLDAEAGVTAVHAEDAAFKRQLVARARRVMLLVTSDKLGTAAPFAVADIAAIDTLVVEGDAPDLPALAAQIPAIIRAH